MENKPNPTGQDTNIEKGLAFIGGAVRTLLHKKAVDILNTEMRDLMNNIRNSRVLKYPLPPLTLSVKGGQTFSERQLTAIFHFEGYGSPANGGLMNLIADEVYKYYLREQVIVFTKEWENRKEPAVTQVPVTPKAVVKKRRPKVKKKPMAKVTKKRK